MSDVVRDTAVPLYLQIAQDIKGKIDRKEIGPIPVFLQRQS